MHVRTEIDEWAEALKAAADDSDHQWKTERAGAGEGLRRAVDAEPHRQALLMRARENPRPRAPGGSGLP